MSSERLVSIPLPDSEEIPLPQDPPVNIKCNNDRERKLELEIPLPADIKNKFEWIESSKSDSADRKNKKDKKKSKKKNKEKDRDKDGHKKHKHKHKDKDKYREQNSENDYKSTVKKEKHEESLLDIPVPVTISTNVSMDASNGKSIIESMNGAIPTESVILQSSTTSGKDQSIPVSTAVSLSSIPTPDEILISLKTNTNPNFVAQIPTPDETSIAVMKTVTGGTTVTSAVAESIPKPSLGNKCATEPHHPTTLPDGPTLPPVPPPVLQSQTALQATLKESMLREAGNIGGDMPQSIVDDLFKDFLASKMKQIESEYKHKTENQDVERSKEAGGEVASSVEEMNKLLDAELSSINKNTVCGTKDNTSQGQDNGPKNSTVKVRKSKWDVKPPSEIKKTENNTKEEKDLIDRNDPNVKESANLKSETQIGTKTFGKMQLAVKISQTSAELISSGQQMDKRKKKLLEEGEVTTSEGDDDSDSDDDDEDDDSDDDDDDDDPSETGSISDSDKDSKSKSKKKKKKKNKKKKKKRKHKASKEKSRESSGEEKNKRKHSSHKSKSRSRSRSPKRRRNSRSPDRRRSRSRERYSKSSRYMCDAYEYRDKVRDKYYDRDDKMKDKYFDRDDKMKDKYYDRDDKMKDKYYDRDDKMKDKYYDRDRWRFSDRERPRERKRSRSKSRSRSRSKSRERPFRVNDLRLKIDKAKLREIAIKNAVAMAKSGQMPSVDMASVKAGGKSINELTDFCKRISSKGEYRAMSSSSDEEHDQKSDDDEGFIHHPFKVKETSIVLNIRDSKPLPVMTPVEKIQEQAKLRIQFPVSSGSTHRLKESDWVPVEKTTSSTATKVTTTTIVATKEVTTTTVAATTESIPATVTPTAPPVVPLPVDVPPNPVAPEDKVFPDIPSQSMDIGSIISERLSAFKKLKENPNDVEARTKIAKAQEQASLWAQSKNLPGKFLGSTGVQILTQEELMGPDKRRQAWAKKDQFVRAAPVNSGIGMALLQKMGWKAGEGLGKNNEGKVEPLALDFKTDRRGLTSLGENSKKVPIVGNAKDLSGKHPVSALVELCNRRRWGAPDFQMVHESGPDHKKNFLFKVIVNRTEYQPSVASNNKKLAKAAAATICLQNLGLVPRDKPT